MKAVAIYEQHPLVGCVDAVLKAPVDVKIPQHSGHVPNWLLGVVPVTLSSYLPFMVPLQNRTGTFADRKNLGVALEQDRQLVELGTRM